MDYTDAGTFIDVIAAVSTFMPVHPSFTSQVVKEFSCRPRLHSCVNPVVTTDFSAVHPMKESTILLTDAGGGIFSKLVQLRNIFEAIIVKFDGNVISFRFVHPPNILFVVDAGFCNPVKY